MFTIKKEGKGYLLTQWDEDGTYISESLHDTGESLLDTLKDIIE